MHINAVQIPSHKERMQIQYLKQSHFSIEIGIQVFVTVTSLVKVKTSICNRDLLIFHEHRHKKKNNDRLVFLGVSVFGY